MRKCSHRDVLYHNYSLDAAGSRFNRLRATLHRENVRILAVSTRAVSVGLPVYWMILVDSERGVVGQLTSSDVYCM